MRYGRRDFLRLASIAGLTVAGPTAPMIARASGERFQGPWLVTVHAGGGWDPTLLCDPKGRASEAEADPVNRYFTGDIQEVGPFRLAPLEGNREFFTRWGSQLLVLNGLDAQTNSHDTGTRHVWSGSMTADMPSIGALNAVKVDRRPALAFLSNGGYDVTAGVIAATRLPSVDAINEIAFPTRLDANEAGSVPWNPAIADRLAQARQARLQRQMATTTHSHLPRTRDAMELLMAARTGDNEIADLVRFLPEQLADNQNALRRQAQVAMASFRAGLSVSASLTLGGYDTHGNHDASHQPRMQALVSGLNAILEEADRQGIADRIILVVGSDFARTPWYNETNGKDHWSITSMLFLGPGIRGNRVVGATDFRQGALQVDPTTLATVEQGGLRVTPGHVHQALRRLLQIADHPVVAPFRVDGAPLPLFA